MKWFNYLYGLVLLTACGHAQNTTGKAMSKRIFNGLKNNPYQNMYDSLKEYGCNNYDNPGQRGTLMRNWPIIEVLSEDEPLPDTVTLPDFPSYSCVVTKNPIDTGYAHAKLAYH
jgi:hypothetical protein